MFEALANSPSPSYQSVKLPAALVNAAKESAQTFRRSTSGQIEYWATLGRNLEIKGLTAMEAKKAIQEGDHAEFGKTLIHKFMAHSQSGQLAKGTSRIIQENRRQATQIDKA